MDARCVDRPAAVVRACGHPALDRALADRIVACGYDVHVPPGLAPGTGERPHPRLHVGRSDVDGVPETLVAAAGRLGSPLALVVGVHPGDLASEVELLGARMGPLRAAGALVIDDGVAARRTWSDRSATSPADPRITVATVASYGAADGARAVRTATRVLERLLAHLARATR